MVGDNRSHYEKLSEANASLMGVAEKAAPYEPSFSFIVKLDGSMAQYGPDIRRFIDAMVFKLEKNAEKGRWETYSLEQAFDLLKHEVAELDVEVRGSRNMVSTMLEAADVANFALIVAAIVMERGR